MNIKEESKAPSNEMVIPFLRLYVLHKRKVFITIKSNSGGLNNGATPLTKNNKIKFLLFKL
jgi:hypothetical protein